MANKLYEESSIQDIADAIREKTGSSRTFSVNQMGQMIRSISDGGNNIFDLVYPVGSIYMSVNNVDPSVLFGGTTWEQIKDAFLLSAGDTYKAGTTGGEATHKLTLEEMPSHSHHVPGNASGGTISYPGYIDAPNVNGTAQKWHAESSCAGDSKAHNNMPPYLTVYMWKRTA